MQSETPQLALGRSGFGRTTQRNDPREPAAGNAHVAQNSWLVSDVA